MKKLLLILPAGLLLSLVSCNNDKGSSGTAANPVAAKNLEAVHGINKAIETGDVSKLGDYIAADAVDHSGEKGEIKGLDSIKATLATIHTMGDNMKDETLNEFADSTTVIQWMRYTGNSKMAMGTMPAGSAYNWMTIHVSKFKDGKATDHWEFMLPSDMMKMMPAPTANPAEKK
jgi:hypothetical protein